MCKGRKEAGRDGGTHPTRTMRESCRSMSHVEAVTAAHDRSWNEIMESIVRHGSEKRSLEPITCGKDKTLPTLWREEGCGPVVSSRTRRGDGGQKGDRQCHRKAMEQGAAGGVYSQCKIVGSAATGAEEEGRGGGGRNARCRWGDRCVQQETRWGGDR